MSPSAIESSWPGPLVFCVAGSRFFHGSHSTRVRIHRNGHLTGTNTDTVSRNTDENCCYHSILMLKLNAAPGGATVATGSLQPARKQRVPQLLRPLRRKSRDYDHHDYKFLFTFVSGKSRHRSPKLRRSISDNDCEVAACIRKAGKNLLGEWVNSCRVQAQQETGTVNAEYTRQAPVMCTLHSSSVFCVALQLWQICEAAVLWLNLRILLQHCLPLHIIEFMFLAEAAACLNRKT